MSVLSQVAPAPVSVMQLVRCNYEKSKCSQCARAEGTMWYVVLCTELCKCSGEGDKSTNIKQPMIGEDLDD